MVRPLPVAAALGALVLLAAPRRARAEEQDAARRPHTDLQARVTSPGLGTLGTLEGAITFASMRAATQDEVGADVVATTQVRPLSAEGAAAPAVDGRLAIVRRVRAFSLTATGAVGRSFGSREDADWQAGALALYQLASSFAIGAEARVRGELEDRLVTAEDEGREVEAASGGVVALGRERARLQALVGWAWPRGMLPSSAAAFVTAAVSF